MNYARSSVICSMWHNIVPLPDWLAIGYLTLSGHVHHSVSFACQLNSATTWPGFDTSCLTKLGCPHPQRYQTASTTHHGCMPLRQWSPHGSGSLSHCFQSISCSKPSPFPSIGFKWHGGNQFVGPQDGFTSSQTTPHLLQYFKLGEEGILF